MKFFLFFSMMLLARAISAGAQEHTKNGRPPESYFSDSVDSRADTSVLLPGYHYDFSTMSDSPTYRAVVSTSERNIKGFLFSIGDSAIYLSESPQKFMKRPVQPGDQKIDLRNILSVQIREKGIQAKSMLLCTAIGLIAGAVLGITTYDDGSGIQQKYSMGSNILFFSVVGGCLGFGVGTIYGTVSTKKFLINGEWRNLQEMKNMLTQ